MKLIKVRDKVKFGILNRTYMWPILKGMFVTLTHLFKKKVTLQYPEEKPTLPERFRGRVVLKRNEEGQERCTACLLCMYACPANAIYIEPKEVTEDLKDKYPEERYAQIWNYDVMRCIFCGFCQDACPKAAVFLENEYEITLEDRSQFIMTKKQITEEEGGPVKIRT